MLLNSLGSMPAACSSLGSIPARAFASNPKCLGSIPPIVFKSKDVKDFGSNPAAWSNFGSIPANIFGSMPIPLKSIDVDEASDVATEVVGTDDGTEVLGDRLCSSLLTLALDGGLGEGEVLDGRGDGADL